MVGLGKNRTLSLKKHQIHLQRFLKIEMPAPTPCESGPLAVEPRYVLNAPQIIQMSSQAYETLVGGWSKYWFSVL